MKIEKLGIGKEYAQVDLWKNQLIISRADFSISFDLEKLWKNQRMSYVIFANNTYYGFIILPARQYSEVFIGDLCVYREKPIETSEIIIQLLPLR